MPERSEGSQEREVDATVALLTAFMTSGKLTQSRLIPFERTSKEMPSTFIRSHVTMSCTSGLHGAMPTPRLPMTTVVIPCHEEQLTSGSQQICASQWVCGSMKPGATIRSEALMTLLRTILDFPDFHDTAVCHADVSLVARLAAAVNNRTFLNHEIVRHMLLLPSAERPGEPFNMTNPPGIVAALPWVRPLQMTHRQPQKDVLRGTIPL